MQVQERRELTELFRDIVVALGGVFAIRQTDDETIDEVARGIDAAYRRAHRRSGGAAPADAATESEKTIADRLRGGGRADARKENGVKSPAAGFEEHIRIPGLFRRWEIVQVLEPDSDFHIEGAGESSDGTPLFAVYRRACSETKE